MAHHLGTDADIVHSKDFEKAVVKVIKNHENQLTQTEKESLKSFLKGILGDDEENNDSDLRELVDILLDEERLKKILAQNQVTSI